MTSPEQTNPLAPEQTPDEARHERWLFAALAVAGLVIVIVALVVVLG